MNIKLIAQTAIGVIGFGIWTYAAFSQADKYQAVYMTFVISSVISVIAVVLRDMKTTSDKPVETDKPKEPTA